MELMDLPLFVPGDTAFRIKLWDALRPLYADLLKKQVQRHLYDVMQLNPRRLYTKTPVETLADIKGLKIRAIGPADAGLGCARSAPRPRPPTGASSTPRSSRRSSTATWRLTALTSR